LHEKDLLWQFFIKTGNLEAYLMYKDLDKAEKCSLSLAVPGEE